MLLYPDLDKQHSMPHSCQIINRIDLRRITHQQLTCSYVLVSASQHQGRQTCRTPCIDIRCSPDHSIHDASAVRHLRFACKQVKQCHELVAALWLHWCIHRSTTVNQPSHKPDISSQSSLLKVVV